MLSRPVLAALLTLGGCALDRSGLGADDAGDRARDAGTDAAGDTIDAGDGRLDAGPGPDDAALPDVGGPPDSGPPPDGCMPRAETCDGTDEDCDGTADEGTSVMPCGMGAGECVPGSLICTMGALECMGGRGPSPEACNDRDDDCDLITDEMNPGGGASCGTDVGACSAGVSTCVGGALLCQGEIAPETETCNAADDDCDASVDESGCPCQREVFRGHIYLFCDDSVRWTTARSRCPPGYHLVQIEDMAENSFVASTAVTINGGGWWTGLNDRGSGMEGTFEWSGTGGMRPGYVNWASGEPNNSGAFGGEDCVEMNPMTGQWNDLDCDDGRRYVCETP